MRVNVAIPEAHVSAPVLNAALEATTRLNESLLKSGEVPHFDQVRNHIRWKPEPPGDEHFDHAKVVLGRKWGDCDDMAPYAAASMRASGEDPGARAIVKKSGPTRWHAVVQRSDGTIRDPSRETGMGQTNGVMGAGLPMMMRPSSVVGEVGTYLIRPQLALRPVRDRSGEVEAWQARADLPWHWLPGKSPADVAMVSLHASPVSSQAVTGACQGLIDLGEANDVDEEILDRAAAIADAAEGATWEQLADYYGPEHATAAGNIVGSFFGGIVKTAKGFFKPKNLLKTATSAMIPGGGGFGAFAANPFQQQAGKMLAKKFMTPENILKFGPTALNFIPGFGPIAAQALEMASPMLQKTLLTQQHMPPQAAQQAQQYNPQQYGYPQQQSYAQDFEPMSYGVPQGYDPRGWGGYG